MMKCESAYPCPCAWLTIFTGIPSTLTCTSVPWSQSNPRKNICSALPPPACCAIKSPGTSRNNSWVFLTGFKSRSILASVLNFVALVLLKTTTSLRLETSGFISIVILLLLPVAKETALYPTYETNKLIFGFIDCSVKFPYASVNILVELDDFSASITVTFSNGCLLTASTTFPFTVIFCALAL